MISVGLMRFPYSTHLRGPVWLHSPPSTTFGDSHQNSFVRDDDGNWTGGDNLLLIFQPKPFFSVVSAFLKSHMNDTNLWEHFANILYTSGYLVTTALERSAQRDTKL